MPLKRIKRPLDKSKRKKGKPVPLSRLKRKLDQVFSLYIRAKYPKKCYTCGKPNCTLQCGHFIPRTYLATRWEEMNCRPQCVGCNIWGRGQLLDFEEKLTNEIGATKVAFLKEIRKQVWKLNRAWYEEKIAYYNDLLAHL